MEPRRNPDKDTKYFTSGFIFLQDMIDNAIIKMQTERNQKEIPGIFLQQTPTPCYVRDK